MPHACKVNIFFWIPFSLLENNLLHISRLADMAKWRCELSKGNINVNESKNELQWIYLTVSLLSL